MNTLPFGCAFTWKSIIIFGCENCTCPVLIMSRSSYTKLYIFDFPGIYTGTIYIDYQLQGRGFKGEGHKYNDVIAVKTHTAFNYQRPGFKRCILILRNPYDAIWAEFNLLRTQTHIRIAEPAEWENQSKSRYMLNANNKKSSKTRVNCPLRRGGGCVWWVCVVGGWGGGSKTFPCHDVIMKGV